ncbi:MAG TPA: oligoribonuclease [Desulfatiglandales bacterium]|nr:oligoribonuclease [Desulfatiglandales bacterium]
MGSNLIWIDLEMTGLDPERMVIIETASVVTDDNLNIIAEGPNIAINYPDNVLNSMEEWSMIQHKASGLLDRVKASEYNCRKAEQETLRFLCSWCKKGESPMCGNTIWQDRRFLKKYMPDLEEFFHYRMIDVSSIKELMIRWYPLIPPYEKKEAHLALMDIYECINELRYYRRNIFIEQAGQLIK